jgi:hypothetical protein
MFLVYAMKAYMGSRGIAPLILNFGTRLKSPHLVCDYMFSISLLSYFQKYLEAALRLQYDTQGSDDKGPGLFTKCGIFRPAILSFSSLFTDEDMAQTLT